LECFSVLLPFLGDLKIPVTVYASVISIMVLFAFNGFLFGKTQEINTFSLAQLPLLFQIVFWQ
jgi:uncharacterized membrane protein YhhN